MNIAINGFGRIGRTSFRVWFDKYKDKASIVAVNTSGSMDLSGWAQLLKYDSNYGVWHRNIEIKEHLKAKETTDQDMLLGSLVIDGTEVQVFAQKDPGKLPWASLAIDTVIEATGVFTSKEKAAPHIAAGAKRVVISAPPNGEGVGTFVIGVNQEQGKAAPGEILANASCTTNCVAPVMAVLQKAFGVKKALMTTVHAYTDDQNLHDNSHRDLRRARGAAQNIVPTTTGAATAVAETIPELKGIFDGLSIRVPVSVGSISDMTVLLNKEVTVEEVNQALTNAAKEGWWQGILAVTNEPLVSRDIVGRSESSIVDLSLTQVVGGDLVKVVSWYDNEFGYCCRLIEQAVVSG